MKHSLRCRLKDLKSWKLITDGECEFLCKALDDMEQHNKDVLEQIRDEIEELDTHYDNDYFSGNNDPMYKCNEVLKIIDKYR